MIRRTTTYLMVVAGLGFAVQSGLEAQILARIPHEQPAPSQACGPTMCAPRMTSYGYHKEVWRRWPGQVDLDGLDLSPFAVPDRQKADAPNVSVPDPRDENSITSPPRDGAMEITPMAPSVMEPNVPSITPPSTSEEMTDPAGDLPSGLDDLPDTSSGDALPDLDGGLGGDNLLPGGDDLLPGGDALEEPAELNAPLDVPTPESDSLDGFLDDLGQRGNTGSSIDGNSSSRRRSNGSPATTLVLGDRANPLRSIDASAGPAEASAQPASYESETPATQGSGTYRPRRQTTMRSIDELPPRPRRSRGQGGAWDGLRGQSESDRDLPLPPRYSDSDRRDYRYERMTEREYEELARREEGRRPAEYYAQRQPRGPEYRDPGYRGRREADGRRVDPYVAPEYRDRRYDEAEYRQRRDRYELADRQRRIDYHRTPMTDRDVQPTSHEEPSVSSTPEPETRRSPTTGRVNPLRAQ